MNDVILPIGTVCTLKNTNKKIMITAFLVSEESNPNEFYDYCGCLWPEGMVDSKNHFLFNKDKIDVVHHIGYSNEEEKDFKSKLNFLLSEKQNLDNNTNDSTNRLLQQENNQKDNNTQQSFSNEQSIFSTLNLNQQDSPNNN